MSYNDDNHQNASDTGRGEFPHTTNFGPDPVRAEVEREFQAVTDSDGEPRTDGSSLKYDPSTVVLDGTEGELRPSVGAGARCPLCFAGLTPESGGDSRFLECPSGDYKYDTRLSRSYSRPHGSRGDGQ